MAVYIPSPATIEAMAAPKLVELYNTLATVLNVATVKRFESRAAGAKRVAKLAADVVATGHAATDETAWPLVAAAPDPLALCEADKGTVTFEEPAPEQAVGPFPVKDYPAAAAPKRAAPKATSARAKAEEAAKVANVVEVQKKTAREQLAELTGAKVKAKKAVADAKKAAAAPKPEKAGTVAARIRELVREGKDNAAIWAIVRPEFGYPNEMRGMVVWHRGNMRRKGMDMGKGK
jgi:hypothetical protein